MSLDTPCNVTASPQPEDDWDGFPENSPPWFSLERPNFASFELSIEECGAQTEEHGECTKAFAAAIEHCHRAGGGTVIVPEGVWMTGPIRLLSHVRLHLEKGARVIFTPRHEAYLPVVLGQRGGSWLYNYSPMIYAFEAENIAVTGQGTFDGRGDAWWPWKHNEPGMHRLFAMAAEGIPPEERVFGTPEDGIRPDMIQFIGCKRVLLDGFRVEESPAWTIHPVCCQHLTISNLTIIGNGPNTDGIDPDSCQNVLIEDCLIDTGDDCLVLKAGRDQDGWNSHIPCQDLLIRRLRALRGHGGIVIGSEISGGVRRVLVEDCDFKDSDRGIRIKTAPGRGGFIEKIHIRDIRMKHICHEAIVLQMDYGSAARGQGGWAFASTTQNPTRIQDIIIERASCEGASHGIDISGDSRQPPKGIHLRDITLSAREGIRLSNALDVHIKNLSLSALSSSEPTSIEAHECTTVVSEHTGQP